MLHNFGVFSLVGKLLKLAGVASVLLLGVSAALAQAVRDFSGDYDLVYQIRVISPDAGSKSSIGSGFQINSEGLIVTNFHVVSAYVNAPDTHEIQYLNQNGETGQLTLLDFDVINDLAVLQHPNPATDFFTLATDLPKKGEISYALGNPRDFGMTLVPGPNNGLVEHSYDEQILFSGSLNPGMSGGPALNADGQVIGVNVATAGSQLSFLVPAAKVTRLLARQRQLQTGDYLLEVAEQVKNWQRGRIQDLIDRSWPAERFGDHELFGEIRHDFQCWGGTNETRENRAIDIIDKSCVAGNRLFLGNQLTAGQILFSFEQKKARKLNAIQFHQTLDTVMSGDNQTNYQHSTNYECKVDFVDGEEKVPGFNKVTLCLRTYKKLPGLYDSLLLVERSESKQALLLHLSLSAVEKDQIKALNRKFMETVL